MSFARSPSIAAVLSFVLPGLGQWSLGALRRGILFAIPAIIVFAAAVATAIADGGAVVETFLRPEILVALFAANLLLCVYHATAIADAYRLGRRWRPLGRGARRVSALVAIAALAASLTMHGAIAAVTYQAYDALGSVFVPSEPGDGWSIPEPSFEPEPTPTTPPSPATTPSPSPSPAISVSPSRSPSPSPAPSPSPSPTPGWAADGRLDLLLVGSDAGPDRWSLRTDTIIVLSVDVATGRTALFGIPRNLVGVPLPAESARAFEGGRFPGLLNALYVYAMGHPSQFPGGEARGFRAVAGAVQELVGVRLDGAIVVNLAGFVRLVNAIGGLWIDVPERLMDANYPLEDGSRVIRLDIEPGCQRLNGRMALAYARSRHQDSDYGRMRRQQTVLLALARQVDPIALLPRVPELFGIAKDNLWTTIRRADIRGLAELTARADTARVTTVVFVPPRFASHLDSGDISRIRRVVRSVFDGGVSSGSPLPSAAPAACP